MSYGRDDLMRLMRDGSREELIEDLACNDSNGCYRDADCEAEGMPILSFDAARRDVARSCSQYEPDVTAEFIQIVAMDEIIKDVQFGHVPRDCKSFADLHEHVDANCYGDTEWLLEEFSSFYLSDDDSQSKALSGFSVIMEKAHDAVDAWIKTGILQKV